MVPADSARIGIVDRIFTRVGAHDDLVLALACLALVWLAFTWNLMNFNIHY